ncbi:MULTISPECIES: CarD family transcriptional regulator [Treponema]|uniref:CarD family transcriptional regulator n=1 Tax=Treponema rectale TaxID=744512 RepID=A0A840SHV2_9SPIR|nr:MULTISPECIES: CarD family transcriptional regulator [Treponema]MBB5219486.1 CarD family transcriptional regulator [Treponema rectale]MBE6354045.1 CarD family transcriptional regulator [Treponema sp.]MBO6177250.1 CarD family transcriptional regulator [Treponema sp.]
MAKPKTEFALNQKVVYPSQGVGKITEIFKRDFKGEQVYFYKIYLEVSDMIVMVPAEKATALGIRAIVSAEEAQEALDLISEDFETPTSDWKLRYQMNLDLLKKGTVKDIASIVRCLYHRSKVKELPILERKLYDNAKKLLEDEIADAMKISVKEVEDMLHARLEPLGAKIEKKPVYSDEDEDDEDEFADERDSSRDSDDDDEDEDD